LIWNKINRKGEANHGLLIAALVAIVAVVGLVILFSGGSKTKSTGAATFLSGGVTGAQIVEINGPCEGHGGVAGPDACVFDKNPQVACQCFPGIRLKCGDGVTVCASP